MWGHVEEPFDQFSKAFGVFLWKCLVGRSGPTFGSILGSFRIDFKNMFGVTSGMFFEEMWCHLNGNSFLEMSIYLFVCFPLADISENGSFTCMGPHFLRSCLRCWLFHF